MNNLEKLTAWMLEQVGTAESGENNVVYNTDYYGREVSGPAFPWCMAFIWDGFHRCGLSELFLDGGKSAYCPYVVQWAKEHGQWVTDHYKPGDLLFYDWDGDGAADHVGFCVYAGSGTTTGIEGNVSDAVARVRRSSSAAMGGYRPAYPDASLPPQGGAPSGGSADCAVMLPELGRGDIGSAVLSVQVLLIHKWQVSCGVDGADGDFGPNTEAAVKAFQRHAGLEADGIVGPITWTALIGR